jgi:hypothetical protein
MAFFRAALCRHSASFLVLGSDIPIYHNSPKDITLLSYSDAHYVSLEDVTAAIVGAEIPL